MNCWSQLYILTGNHKLITWLLNFWIAKLSFSNKMISEFFPRFNLLCFTQLFVFSVIISLITGQSFVRFFISFYFWVSISFWLAICHLWTALVYTSAKCLAVDLPYNNKVFKSILTLLVLILGEGWGNQFYSLFSPPSNIIQNVKML